MKLRKKDEGLSDSLMNISQITDDESSKHDKIKSQILIRSLKIPNDQINTKELFKNINETKTIPNLKSKPKRSRKIVTNIDENNSDQSIKNASVLDIVLPKRKYPCKVEADYTSVSSKTNSVDLIDKSGTNSSRASSRNNTGLTSNSALSNSEIGSFKTPLLPRKSSSKSFKSPIFASSPKPELKNVKNSSKTSDSDFDLFSSRIISSSEDFESCQSSLNFDNSAISPIKKPQSSVEKVKKIKPTRLKKTSKSLVSKPITRAPEARNHSFPLDNEPVVRTRFGRVIRSTAQTPLGKYIQGLYDDLFYGK